MCGGDHACGPRCAVPATGSKLTEHTGTDLLTTDCSCANFAAPDGAAAAARETAGAPTAACAERGSQNGAVHSAASSAANGTAGGAPGGGGDAAASAATDAAAKEAPEVVAQEHEWEGGTEGGVLGSELSDLFHEPVEMQARAPSSHNRIIFLA